MRTSEIVFVPKCVMMAMVPFLLAVIQSPFPIRTFAISVDCNVLKRLLSKVM